MTKSLIFWLQTTFQNKIQVALQLSRSPAPQQTPFVNKYKAIQILNDLLTTQYSFKFIPLCLLGDIYNEVQQLSDSIKAFKSALQELIKLPVEQVGYFSQYLIIIYNMLGISYSNRQQLEIGMACLIQANKIYQQWKQHPGRNVYHYRNYPNQDRIFKYLYQGGVDYEQIEDSHTLTLFYLAQAYTKVGLKDKAAQYCGKTLQRQYSTGKYQLKQFVNNLIGLAQYFQGNKYYSQAQYIYMLALKVIPEGKKKKLRANVNISIGGLLSQILAFSCKRISNQDIQQSDNQVVSKQILIFKQFQQQFPKTILPIQIQGCKSLFRQANTQFKKAIQIFVLDGYVTQHIDILCAQSQLYKSLSLLQKSIERQASMLQKRRQLLQPLLKELNPKAFPATWQKILVQVSEIINDLFTVRHTVLGAKGFPSQQKFKACRQLGIKAINYYKQICLTLQSDKQQPRNQHFYRGIVNSKINISKATSKLMSSDRKQRVNYLKQSLELYQGIISYITKQVPQNFRDQFKKQLDLTKDMIGMLPAKIDKINYSPGIILE